MNTILTLATARNGTITEASLQCLGVARRIQTEQGGRLHSVLIGANLGGLSDELIAHGSDVVYLAEDSALAEYLPEAYLAAVETAFRQAEASLVLAVSDDIGRDLVPRLAYRLSAASLTEVIDFRFSGEQIQWIRPIYGGKAHGVYTTLCQPQVHALRNKTFDRATREEGRSGDVIKLGLALDLATIVARVVEKVQETVEGIGLEDAKIVISGGRGLGGPEGFNDLRELARVLGGAVGASRGVADLGWVPPSMLVGQSGKQVAPDLYIAIGISGASQHLAGCAGARTLVAINNDPDAPIFRRADLGVVADWRAVFPHLLERCKEIVQQLPTGTE